MLLLGGLVVFVFIQTFGTNALAMAWQMVMLLAFCITFFAAWRVFKNRHSKRVFGRHVTKKYHGLVDHKYLLDLTPKEFEEFVASLFVKQGYVAQPTPDSGDEGIDIILEKKGRKYVVQTKKYALRHKVVAKEVRDFYGSYAKSDVQTGFFVTTSTFTAPAATWALTRRMKLISGNELERLMEKHDVSPLEY